MIRVLKKGAKELLIAHFHQSEFDCKCVRPDCKITLYSNDIGFSFRLVRVKLGVPILISSGYRCPAHNSEPLVGGAALSLHQSGQAIDLMCPEGITFVEFASTCNSYFKKIIAYPNKNFVHCQCVY